MHYLAWPLVEGDTLDKIIAEQGRLASPQAAQIARQVAEGLDVCHQHGLIHGLLKPSNLMIGSNQQVFILDFGIGCLLAETEGESLVDTMSTANSVTSGLDCASPESIMDPTNLTPAGDQYSLGCVLYYMLTGQYPFPEGNAAEKMMAHQFQQPRPIQELNPEVSPEMIEIVSRLMQKAPDARYGSAGEAVEALRPLSGSGLTVRPSLKKPAPDPIQRIRAAVQKPEKTSVTKPPPVAVTPPPVAPSTPTPRPQTIGSLPTRDVLRRPAKPGQSAPQAPEKAPAPPPVPPVAEKPGGERVIPGGVAGSETPPDWDDQLGPLGVALSAGVACTLVYILAVLFRIF
jgi:serine/threonine-protein kinase